MAKKQIIPAEYYERTPNYVAFDKTIPASDIARINAQQDQRNLAFQEFMNATKEVTQILLHPMAYRLVETAGNPTYRTIANRAVFQIPDIAPKWEGAFNHYHLDAWVPATAAKVAISQAKDSLLWPDEEQE